MGIYDPVAVSATVTLDGVDITSYVDFDFSKPHVTRELDDLLDTMRISLKNASALDIHAWQEIIVMNGSKYWFGGYVMGEDKLPGASDVNPLKTWQCNDYGAITDKVYVRAEYENKTDNEIIVSVFALSDELSGFDVVTHVKTLKTFPKVRFNRWSVRRIMNWICNQTGGHWRIDYDKTVHYFGAEESTADFDVTDNPVLVSANRKTVQGFEVNKNGGMNVINSVEVVGGKKLSADTVDSGYFPNGIVSTIDLTHRYKPPVGGTKIGVRRNDGGSTTNLVVNPSFEVNITDGWTQYQGGTGAVWASDATKYSSGVKSLKITAGTAVAAVRGGTIALAAGETLTIQARVWCATAAKAGIVLYDISNSIRRDEQFNRKTSQWETVTATWHNTTGGSINVRVDLENVGNDSTLVAYFDAVQAEKKTWPSAYCDGSLGTGYAWTGTANNSTSTRVDMPVWTTLTVKTGGTDTLEGINDVLYYESIARLEQENYWPGIRNAVEVTGRVETPIRVISLNQSSHDFYGHWLHEPIIAPEIVDESVALMRAISVLVKSAFVETAGSYKVLESGLIPGQSQRIDQNVDDVHGSFLIQRVEETLGVGGYVEASVEFGAVDKSYTAYILSIARKSEPEVEWNDNEVLDESLFMSESLGISDDAYDYDLDGVVDESNVDECYVAGDSIMATEGPYLWGVNITWGFFTWNAS